MVEFNAFIADNHLVKGGLNHNKGKTSCIYKCNRNGCRKNFKVTQGIEVNEEIVLSQSYYVEELIAITHVHNVNDVESDRGMSLAQKEIVDHCIARSHCTPKQVSNTYD